MSDIHMKREGPAVVLAVVLACALWPATAGADQAADAFDAWNAAFLVQNSGQTYYATTVTTAGTMRSGTWVGALDIAVAEDAYQRTHSADDRQRVSALLTTFVAAEGTDWSQDTWDDDLAWMVIAVLRGYQITGDGSLLTIAENNWNVAYDRGWDTKYGGGGVWEDLGHVTPTFNQPSKCCLSNDPLIKMGLVLYRMTGNTSYLDKAEGMYAWIRSKLFDATTGLINECLAFKDANDTTGFVQTSDNAYNSGSFLEAADDLYRITGVQSYYDDALLTVTHRVTENPILHDNGQGERQWAYRFVKGLSEFATYQGLWPQYASWLQNNANAAWSQRDALNVTWNDWTNPTPLPGANGVAHSDDVVPLCTSSAAAIWQMLPPASAPPFSGVYELRNLASGLSLGVSGSANGGAVVQSVFDGGSESFWTLVPSSGGYYEIKNVSSGLLLDVQADSYALGATVVQALPEAHGQGNDQWLPVSNVDGSYSFFSLSSALALDDPQSSTAPGTSPDQWSGNGTMAQSFALISHVQVDAGASAGPDSSVDAAGMGSETGAGIDAGAGSGMAEIDAASADEASTSDAPSGGAGGIDASAGIAASGAPQSSAGALEAQRSGGCTSATTSRTGSSRAAITSGLLVLLALVAKRRCRSRRARGRRKKALVGAAGGAMRCVRDVTIPCKNAMPECKHGRPSAADSHAQRRNRRRLRHRLRPAGRKSHRRCV